MIRFQEIAKSTQSPLIILLSKEQVSQKNLKHIPQSPLRSAVLEAIAAAHFYAEKGESFPFIVAKKVVLLLGLGEAAKANPTALRVLVRQAAFSSYFKNFKQVEILPHQSSDEAIIAIIEGIAIGTYRWDKYLLRKAKEDSVRPCDKQYIIHAPAKPQYIDAMKICEGVNFARNLVNDNADTIDSQYLETVIKGLIRGKKNVGLEILNQRELKANGLNLHLAVNQASRKEPKLIIVRYQGAGQSQKFTAIVGKGITFDTGGLNLKPTGHIETMRCDMSGAAAVIGALRNTLELNIKQNVIFAIGVAENAIGSGAFKPGDVFRGYSGKTVEILNTDAEGRLVLADALAYIEKNYKPARFIDLATLTGACVIALGNDYSGLVSNDDDFARDVIRASNRTDDRAWRLPSYPEISEYIKSEIADIKNVGLPKGAGGAITAAEFLRQFVNETPWVHLDIAGTAFVDGKSRWYYGHGATGAGVRLLTNYLQNKE